MSNANTFQGFYNLPAITLTGTSATIYPVPATGVYPGLPAPTQLAGNWLVLPALSGDVSSGGVLDARPFKVRVSGKINNAQSETITFTFYQVTAAGFAAGPTATNSTGVSSLVSSAAIITGATNGKANVYGEVTCMWDAQSKILNGVVGGLMNNTVVAATKISTAVTGLGENDLNFAFAVTAGTTGTGDVIGPLDFTIERF